jgi:hypothetical protein
MLQKLRSCRNNLTLRAFAWRNDYDPADSLIICSDPRGVSTWLRQVIGVIPGTASIWEPLTLKSDSPFRALGFSYRQHIPDGERWPEAEAVFEQLFRGKLLKPWLVRFTDLDALVRADQLIFKFCRANALLPWLTTRFQFRYKPLYLIRHPLAVVASQLRHGGWTRAKCDEIFGSPFDEVYRKHESYIRSLDSKEEYLTARWCVTNLIPLRSPHNNERWTTLNYEMLLLEPRKQLERVFDTWNIEMPEAVMKVVQVPSRTTREPTFKSGVDEQLKKWKNDLTSEQIGKMLRVLEHFEVECYSEDVLPLISYPPESAGAAR